MASNSISNASILLESLGRIVYVLLDTVPRRCRSDATAVAPGGKCYVEECGAIKSQAQSLYPASISKSSTEEIEIHRGTNGPGTIKGARVGIDRYRAGEQVSVRLRRLGV